PPAVDLGIRPTPEERAVDPRGRRLQLGRRRLRLLAGAVPALAVALAAVLPAVADDGPGAQQAATATGAVTFPLPGASLSGLVHLAATASVGGGSRVAVVDFLVDGKVVGSDTRPPYTLWWNASGKGKKAKRSASHTFAVAVWDDLGNRTVSPGVAA